MATLITPPNGNTPQSLALNNLQSAFSNISGVAPQAAPVMAQAAQMQANAPEYQQQTTQANQQQAGMPGLIGNYADTAKLQAMFAADSNFAQYMRPDLQNTGNAQQGAVLGAQTTNQAPDVATAPGAPVPQTPVLTLASLANGFQGFSTPGAAMGEQALQGSQYSNALDLLSKAIQFNAGQVASNVNTNTSNYASATNALTSLANLLQQGYTNSLYAGSSPTNAGTVFNSIIDQVQSAKGGQATETDLWNYINQHDAALRAQGINVDQLWALEKDLARKVGGAGQPISGGTKTPSSAKTNWQYKAGTPGILNSGIGYTAPKIFNPATGITVNIPSTGIVSLVDPNDPSDVHQFTAGTQAFNAAIQGGWYPQGASQ